MSDVNNLGNYTFAAGLFVLGLNAWQVSTSLLFAFTVIFVGMNWMGYIGQRTGIPLPVVARMSFGVFSANLPALFRAVIANFWYGIQTYLASVAIVVLILAWRRA
jgi:NCS1 family nucleobase:cation symporter-1